MADVDLEVELPEDVDVATCTILAYSDGRPTEILLATTTTETVAHFRPGPLARAAVSQLLEAVSVKEAEEVMISDGATR